VKILLLEEQLHAGRDKDWYCKTLDDTNSDRALVRTYSLVVLALAVPVDVVLSAPNVAARMGARYFHCSSPLLFCFGPIGMVNGIVLVQLFLLCEALLVVFAILALVGARVCFAMFPVDQLLVRFICFF
jgi:hypothetical protein